MRCKCKDDKPIPLGDYVLRAIGPDEWVITKGPCTGRHVWGDLRFVATIGQRRLA